MNGSDVSVVIPARNGLPFVIEAVESVLAQSLPPREVIVVDDSSDDGTGDAIVQRFGSRAGGTEPPVPVRVVRGRFGSAAAARNAGWRTALAPWVALLDADDVWFPEKLSTAAGCLAANPAAEWFFSDGTFVTLAGETQASWLASWAELPDPYVGCPVAELIEVNFVLTSSVVVRRAALETLGGFDESMSHAEDLDLWIRLARRGPAVASSRALVRYQHHPGGLTRQVMARLLGDVTLFERLARDSTFDPALRRSAHRRAALARWKLALEAVREGRPADARRDLLLAWMFPERAVPVAVLFAAACLPPAVFRVLRRGAWAKPGVAGMARVRRVVLRPTVASVPDSRP